MKGSTYKRCKCRDADGKELGSACPKLRRANDTWNPRHGTWYFRLELDAGPNGKRRPGHRRGGFASQDEAQDALDEAKERARLGVNVARKVTVGQHLEAWMAGKKRTRASTNLGYESIIRVHLIKHLGHIELGRLRVDQVAAMFEAIDAENERTTAANAERAQLRQVAKAAGRDRAARQEALDAIAKLPPWKRPTGPVTRQRIRDVLRNALNAAKVQGLVPVNVAELVELEAAKRAKPVIWTAERVEAWSAEYQRAVAETREAAGGRAVDIYRIWKSLDRPSKVMVWTPAQTGAFLEQATKHRLYAAFHLIAFTGLRRGEACGAEWANLDEAARQLAVRINRVQLGWKVEEGVPKTDASDAHVALDSETLKVLKAHRKQQRMDQMAWGEAWAGTGKMFTCEDGSPLHPATMTEQFERLAYEAGLPPLRLHDLRHGAATLALAAGVDMKVISAMLRHSSTTITSDTYTSILPDVAREAAEAVAAMVPRKVVGGGSPRTYGLPSDSPARKAITVKITESENMQVDEGAPGRIRTCGTWFRNQLGDVSGGDK
jgi:integrase